MILAVDVSYRHESAVVAGVAFQNWADSKIQASYVSIVESVDEYTPGLFYRRELPCILQLISRHRLAPATVIIDGYVYLDGCSRPGLGRYLYDALEQRASIIGVAKSPFKGIGDAYRVHRGNSSRPLYVTCAGIDLDLARRRVMSMHGVYRVPTLLKQADQLSRAPVESDVTDKRRLTTGDWLLAC